MNVATFRFYAGLNRFLPSARRQCTFSAPFAEQSTVKHMIEALGAPHTEVDLILVNDKPVGFDHPIQPNDRVAVYPAFHGLALGENARLRPPPAVLHFVADAHMGALARLLRLAGFDTLYYPNISDDEIARYCETEQRIALTRDRELLKRSVIVHACYIRSNKPERQLQEVFERYELATHVEPFSRCLVCNGRLYPVDKLAVLHRLPPKVQEQHERFLQCTGCERVYWEGTHWASLRSQLDALLPPS
ncbi:hypothetical protein IQ22_01750 [Pseudomonas duriflava]|uniref:Twitching motility protein PilT n=1 Tax=Pseudomonas duriflava TaxID=459528 RepID=A0A562QDK5_9PSED|nr:Mut7-C RNAse domain-containing protein [Pseudomonas duriflava]TWI54847.1 hypothetical protein IQ22_01750 [Pseudomonas duriflava]